MTPTLEGHLIRHPNILCPTMEVCFISQRSRDPLPMSRESWGTTHVPKISGNDPHVHLHERLSTPIRQRSGGQVSPINSQGLH